MVFFHTISPKMGRPKIRPILGEGQKWRFFDLKLFLKKIWKEKTAYSVLSQNATENSCLRTSCGQKINFYSIFFCKISKKHPTLGEFPFWECHKFPILGVSTVHSILVNKTTVCNLEYANQITNIICLK